MRSDSIPRRPPDANDQPRLCDPPSDQGPRLARLVAWDLLFNNLTTGLFLFAAISELASPVLFSVRGQGGVSSRWSSCSRPDDAGARPGRPAPVPPHAAGVQAQFAHVAGHVESHHLFVAADPIVAIEAAQRSACRHPGRSRWNGSAGWPWSSVSCQPRIRRLQGGALQHQLAAGLEGRPWLGGFMANSARTLGCAAMLAVSVLTGHARAAATLRTVPALLLVLNVIPPGLLFLEPSRDALADLPRAASSPRLGAHPRRRNAHPGGRAAPGGPPWILAAGIFLLLAIWRSDL